MVGHLGDGNFHVLFPYDPNDKDAYKKIRDFSNKLIDKTLELKGTITGEHGVGLHKKSYLLKEHPDNIPLMKTIKRSFRSQQYNESRKNIRFKLIYEKNSSNKKTT